MMDGICVNVKLDFLLQPTNKFTIVQIIKELLNVELCFNSVM